MDIDQGNREPEYEWSEQSVKRFVEAQKIEKIRESYNEEYKVRLAERLKFYEQQSKDVRVQQ